MPRRPTRREFVQGTAAATAILASGSRGALSAVAAGPAGGSNGGRSQLNFNFVQWGGAYPFINALKGAQGWSAADNSGTVPPDTLNANGYPIRIVQGGVYPVFYITSETDRPGNWRIRWIGTGRIAATGGFDQTATDGDFTYSPGDTRIDLRILAGTDITNVEFFHEDDEPLLDAGEVFNTKFLDTIRAGGWGVLRFLDWQVGNSTNVRHWADRKPVDYFSYHTDEYRAPVYAGATTNSGDDYACTAPPGWTGLVDKAMVTVRFNATSSGVTPTLDVAGTGAKTIRTPSGDEMHPNLKPSSGRYGTLVYDADLDVWLKFGGDGVEQFSRFLINGVPVEIMLRLCIEIGAHPWFCTPYLSCDPITDWLTGLATYMRDNAPSWMIPRYEVVPNETWNFANGFYSTRYAWLKSKVHWPSTGSTDQDNWVGKVGSTGGQAVSAVYGNDRSRYQSIVGCQTHGSTSPTARLASTLYVSEDGGGPAYDWTTHLALANYVSRTYTTEQSNDAAAAFAEADEAGKVVIATAYAESTLVDLGGEQYTFSVPRLLNTLVPAFQAWAEGYGVMGMTFYEGGWSPDYTGGQDDLNALKKASRMVPEQVEITRQLYDGLFALGCEFPSHYYLSGGGVWALFDPDVYATPSPQYTAVTALNGQ